jgi:hypothetical protein
MYRDLPWSKSEKQIARRAFDAAYEKECRAISAKLMQMTHDDSDPRYIWRIHDYLSEQRRATDEKYDYRYSVLIRVFGALIREGWLTEADLQGLSDDKLRMIRDWVTL